MERRLRILIVDDNSGMVNTLRDIFTSAGYEVFAARSGTMALRKLTAMAFDCVLSDVAMAGLSGVALHQAIQARRPGIPVVLMTAYASPDLVQEGMTAGVVAVLDKPLDVPLLLKFFAYLRRRHLLAVVTDDGRAYAVVRAMLDQDSYTVKSVAASEVEADVLGETVGAVVLDLDLVHVDGMEILRQLVTHAPQLPVLLITARRKKAATLAAATIASCDYLPRPFAVEQLLQALHALQHGAMMRMLA